MKVIISSHGGERGGGGVKNILFLNVRTNRDFKENSWETSGHKIVCVRKTSPGFIRSFGVLRIGCA